MTMEKLGGMEGNDYRFYCDGICSDYLNCGDDFYSALDELKSNGWKTIKNGHNWEHYCLDCKDKKGLL